jgi:hypothetical protein
LAAEKFDPIFGRGERSLTFGGLEVILGRGAVMLDRKLGFTLVGLRDEGRGAENVGRDFNLELRSEGS